ncbi:MAG: exodeoxyribonuclease V subunit gamma [Saprospiraceae bacterium]|nr:exodeoxyribonuclease V subunit gamma [Saprospiraceae bacterium]
MGIHIPISNDITKLADTMIEDIGLYRFDVFQPVYIVTQTKGMNSWLKYRMSEQHGVAANLMFLTPEEIVYEVYKILGGSYKDKIDRKDMDWLIYAALSDEAFKEKFPERASYFYNEEGRDKMKQWELAAKMGDLFDQYQIYRSEVIAQWKVNELESLEEKSRWQAYLWKKIDSIAGDKIIDFNAIKVEILEKLKTVQNQERLVRNIPVLHLFGLSIITKYHLEIIHAMSEHIDIRWYANNPAPDYYWFEDEPQKVLDKWKAKNRRIEHITVGHPLLTDWGKVIQSIFRLISGHEEFINAITDLPLKQNKGTTLLASLQQSIQHNAVDRPDFDTGLFDDDTISITSNYSKKREVETLYNYILDTIATKRHGDILDREIIVMATDINAYAPYIRAVMDNAPYRFKYNIADEALANVNSPVAALISLLEFDGKLFGAEEVLGLLTHKYIREKFRINDLELIRNTIVKANARFGIENDYSTPMNDTFIVSWRYALEKIFYGICLPGEIRIDNEHPFYTVETTDTVAGIQEISAFLAFFEALKTHVHERKNPKPLREWRKFIEQVLEDMFAIPDDEKNEDYVKKIEKLIRFENLDDGLKDEEIPYDVFSKRFLAGLKVETTSTRFMSRGITFCSPLPFRSLPFKLVCMLGLNHGEYPRLERRSDFDLIASNRKLGDRNLKENDKHLFLESILSAEKALYLSYIGRSIKDNEILPPSILIDELLDYLQMGNVEVDVRKKLVSEHPFYSFSTKYNKDSGNLLPNYFIQLAKEWPIPYNDNREVPEIKEYDINTVWKFFEKNIQYYYNNVLGVYFEREDGDIKDTENFELDSLEEWTVKESLLDSRLKGVEKAFEEKLYLSGQLPLKNVGLGLVDEIDEVISPLVDDVKNDFPDNFDPKIVSIEITYDDVRYFGEIKNVIDNKIISFHHGSSGGEAKRRARLAFQYLFAVVCNVDITGGALYTLNGKHTLKQLGVDEARARLGNILTFFHENKERLIGYSAELYSQSLNENDSFEKIKNFFFIDRNYRDDYYRHVMLNHEIDIDRVWDMHVILKEILLDNAY